MAPPLAGFNQPAAFAQAPPMTQPAPVGFAPGKSKVYSFDFLLLISDAPQQPYAPVIHTQPVVMQPGQPLPTGIK